MLQAEGVVGYTLQGRLSGIFAEHIKKLLFHLTPALFPFLWGQNGNRTLNDNCLLTKYSRFRFAFLFGLCVFFIAAYVSSISSSDFLR